MTKQSITLYTTYYHEKDNDRRAELELAIVANTKNLAISKIVILNEGGDLSFARNEKVIIISIANRPYYSDFFQLINTTATAADVSIIANTDIFFDTNINVLEYLPFNNCCFALSRWYLNQKGRYQLYNRNDSQDVWIFKGRVKNNLFGDFSIGVPRCDNRLLYELKKAGYKVCNPAYSIKTFHLHKDAINGYPVGNSPGYISEPYGYLFPHNQYNLINTLRFNFTHKCKLSSYRYDIKKINKWLVIRLIRKLINFPLIGYK